LRQTVCDAVEWRDDTAQGWTELLQRLANGLEAS
jgi:hypothetical protein